MESYLISSHYDLITPDGFIQELELLDEKNLIVSVNIKNISPVFVGYEIDPTNVLFNLKSTLAQLGVDGILTELSLDRTHQTAEARVHLIARSPLASKMLPLLQKGAFIGKLFAADERRKVRDPEYLTRMFGRCDKNGHPLLSFGNTHGKEDFLLEKIEGFTVAFLPLKKGIISYKDSIENFLPTLAEMLKHKQFETRKILSLHQKWEEGHPFLLQKDNLLLVRTAPLHIRTVFAKVVDSLLPKGYHHSSACVLQPDTLASGDIYEFFGSSSDELKDVPLEFYTLEPHREHVFFSDRDQLQSILEKPENLFKAFKTISSPDLPSAVFIVKGKQLEHLSGKDWITRKVHKHDFPGFSHPSRQALLIEKYIEQQPSYPFLKALEEGLITSQGVLFSRYFPSPLLKRMILSHEMQRFLKGIYFQLPSQSHSYYFSHEDRSFLADLAQFAIPVFWVDEVSGNLLQYVVKPDKDTGLFVPNSLIETFRHATIFGIYGSYLIEGNFEKEVQKLLQGILDLRPEIDHPLLSKDTPLALLTGGGAGAMEVGNRVAQNLNILSCANIVDFRTNNHTPLQEQKQNSHIEAKMTYRLDRLVERQAEFRLDFPIFLMGGIGMDFEFNLEEVRRKVGASPPTPCLLFGETSYWEEKISSRFQCNRKTGTTKGSEWVSNCFYCIQTAKQGLEVYRHFFKGTLPIGIDGPIYPNGFCKNPSEIPF